MSNELAVRVFIAMAVTISVFGYGVTHGVGWLYSLAAGYGATCFVSVFVNAVQTSIQERR